MKIKFKSITAICLSVITFFTINVKAMPIGNKLPDQANKISYLKNYNDFDWEQERERERQIFREYKEQRKKEAAQYKKTHPNSNGVFPAGENGDVLITQDSSSVSWIPFIGHAGMIKDKQYGETVESNPERGVFFGTYDDQWAGKHSLCIMECTEVNDHDRLRALEWAVAQEGKPYNYNFFDRYREDCFYCSQLVWFAYRHGGNTDLCDGDVWPVIYNCVSPAVLYRSQYLTAVYER